MVNVRADEVQGWTEEKQGWSIVSNKLENDLPGVNEAAYLRYNVPLSALVMLLVMLWASTSQAALVYLDAAFASDTVAQDSTGLNVVETLTANSSGVVWGGKVANTQIYRITNGVYEEFAVPSPGVGAMQMQDNNTLLVGTYYVGSASGSAKVYQVDSAGVASEFFTLPTGRNRVIKMSVSPVNGDILITANERILKYSSAGVLQWDVVQPLGNQPVTAFNPAGEAIVNGENGAIYSIDESTGAFTLLPVSVPTDFEWGASHIFDMVFSNNENVYSSLVSNNNNIEIFRTNLSTGESNMLAHWDFEVPAIERWLEYVDGQGLYTNSFDANDLSSHRYHCKPP